MIQIEDWMILAGFLAIFTGFFVYLLFFKVSKKLFPQNIRFEKEIQPHTGSTICEVIGIGIVKTIELQTNNNCILTMIVDGTNHTLLNIEQEFEDNSSFLTVKEQLNQRFNNNFAIHIHNKSGNGLKYIGKASYEIKKKLTVTIKTVFEELA